MANQLVPSLIALAIVSLLLFFFKRPDSQFLKALSIIATYHLLYAVTLLAPIEYSLQFQNTSMNWTGKIGAMALSIAFYFFIKKRLVDCDFITRNTKKDALKKVILVGTITWLVMCFLTVAFSNGARPLNVEKLLYQLTMPGLDEELWRAILLGLMIPIVKDRKFKLGHPALWATTIIFSLIHSVYMSDGQLGFAPDAFIVTGLLGYILGWTTLKSRSLLPAIILHNLINFSTNFLEMYVL